jgi:hypothetical protein
MDDPHWRICHKLTLSRFQLPSPASVAALRASFQKPLHTARSLRTLPRRLSPPDAGRRAARGKTAALSGGIEGIDMRRKQVAQWRPWVRGCVGACLLLAGVVAKADPQGDVYTMSRSVIASGGGIVSADCYVLVSTIGEPVVGIVADAEFTLSTGFLGEVAVRGDLLFRTGFETKKGECKP